MKVCACLIIVAIIAAAQAITDEQKQKIIEITKVCQSQSGASQESIEKTRKGEFEEDPKLKAQILCFGIKAGLATESGDAVVDVMKSRLKAVGTSDEEIEKIVAKCAVKKDTPEQTAFNTYKCLRENKPNFLPV